MLIKNLRLYDIDEKMALTWGSEARDRLQDMADNNPARECQNQETVTIGWAPVLDNNDDLLVEVAGAETYLLRVVWHKRVLPPAVIKKALKDRVAEIEEATGETVKGKRKRDLEDDIRNELLPKAFQKTETAVVMVVPTRQQIWFDQSSAKKCEDVLSMMRKQIGSLPVKPSDWSTNLPFKAWAISEAPMPDNLSMGGDIQLSHLDDGVTSKITIRKEHLDDEDIQSLIPTREINEMALTAAHLADFKVTSEGVLKSIRFDSELRGQYSDEDSVDGQLFLVIKTLGSIIDMVSDKTSH